MSVCIRYDTVSVSSGEIMRFNRHMDSDSLFYGRGETIMKKGIGCKSGGGWLVASCVWANAGWTIVFAVPWGRWWTLSNCQKGREKQKEKTSWVECGASRVEEEGGGQRALLFLFAHYKRAKLILQANGWDFSREPRFVSSFYFERSFK